MTAGNLPHEHIPITLFHDNEYIDILRFAISFLCPEEAVLQQWLSPLRGSLVHCKVVIAYCIKPRSREHREFQW